MSCSSGQRNGGISLQRFMITQLTCSAVMTVLALFYIAVTPLLARRYSEKGRYYAWLIIVIGFIIPFRPQFGSSIVKITATNTVAPIVQIGNGAPVIRPIENAAAPVTALNISFWHVAVFVWLAGVVVFLVYHLMKHYRFAALSERWSEPIADEQALSLLENLKVELGISRQIGVYNCLSVGSPMLMGFIHPRILMPEVDFEQDELYFILKHELIHYKRKDLWYRFLVLVATALHWFNPLVYLMARATNALCEMSCDAEVIHGTDADIRQRYSETIIGVVKYQSKMKTALSTNFYGGKNGMKKRIFSIMDTSKKKAGFVVLCGVLSITLGTGVAFASNTELQGPSKIIRESIAVKPVISVSFLPDPDIYAQYADFGISVSEDGTKLLYEGQPVRLFVDDESDTESFYFDESASLNLSVVRNAASEITGIESISAQRAQEYHDAFFAEELSAIPAEQNIDFDEQNKYDQYSPFGLTLLAEEDMLYFNGQRVKLLVDLYEEGWFGTFWTDDAGTVNLEVVRDMSGKINSIEIISDEKAQEYRTTVNKKQQTALDELDKKVTKRINELYPEN